MVVAGRKLVQQTADLVACTRVSMRPSTRSGISRRPWVVGEPQRAAHEILRRVEVPLVERSTPRPAEALGRAAGQHRAFGVGSVELTR